MTVHGKPSAILIAPEDLEALEETLAIMRDAAMMNRLAESDAELARGEHVSAEERAEAVRRRHPGEPPGLPGSWSRQETPTFQFL